MSGTLAVVPPAIPLFVLAIAAAVAERRAGHAIAVVGSFAICAWLLAVPAGAHLRVPLFGFEAVLFSVDAYSRLLGLSFAFLAAVGAAYGFATGADRRQTAYALSYVGAGMGVAFAGDWLSFVVYLELMAVCATVLLWHRATDRSAGTRYAIYHELGGLAFIAGVVLHYDAAGTFVFDGGIAAGLPAALVAFGIGLNAGFVGLHVWLVDAYPRTHVATSAVLAAVTTKVGAYAVVRAFPDGQAALAYLGGAMVLFGVVLAVLQTDVRRLLSYHIVSQVGYMVAGFGAGAALASAGAMAHLVNNVLYKTLLFMVAGILIHRTGTDDLKAIGGAGRAMPATAVVFLIAALSIAGLPGFNGFVSKGMVVDGVEKAGFDVLWYALVIGGVGTVLSFAKFGYYAFLRRGDGADYEDLTPLELGTLGVVAALCVLLGVVPALLFALLPTEGVAGAAPYAAKQFPKTAAATAAGLVGFVAIRTRLYRVTPVPDLDAVYNPIGRRLQDLSVAVAGAVEDGIDRSGGTIRDGTLRVGGSGRAGRTTRAPAVTTGTIGVGALAIALVLGLLLAVLLLG